MMLRVGLTFLTLIAAISISACAPASLEKVPASRTTPADLDRGFQGQSDPAALAALGTWIEKHHRESGPFQVGPWTVRFATKGKTIINPATLESLRPAANFELRGLAQRQRIPGIGVPMIGYRPNDGSGPHDSWNPPEGIFRAVTAVPELRGSAVEIRVYDRLRVETIKLRGKTQPLAGDLSAPWAALLERTKRLRTTALTSLVTRDTGRDAGLFLVEEYDPEKTPVLLIHGLLSTPLMWAELTNELWGDPRIRSEYQIWHYLYPTNAPALYPARLLRSQLDELRISLDPELNDPAMQRTVVVAHSMGGLLAKTLVVEPRDAFWDAAFTKSLDDLDTTSAERATLEEAWFWQAHAHVDRIVFCAVPFRGSKMADSFIGRIGQWISAPRDEWQDFYRELERKNPGMLTDDYQQLTRSKLTSVSTLSPAVRSMQILDELPIQHGVGRHLIVGTRGKDGPIEDSSDGIVPFWSSSLPQPDSLKAVPDGHSLIEHPETVAEIKRILRLPSAR
ncbi:MAG: alpha/beta hydrolase [Verrucomicrobiota bacterium]